MKANISTTKHMKSRSPVYFNGGWLGIYHRIANEMGPFDHSSHSKMVWKKPEGIELRANRVLKWVRRLSRLPTSIWSRRVTTVPRCVNMVENVEHTYCIWLPQVYSWARNKIGGSCRHPLNTWKYCGVHGGVNRALQPSLRGAENDSWTV